MHSKIKVVGGLERLRASQFPVFALVALLVGCSSGSGGGGGEGGSAGAGGNAGAGGHAGGAGNGAGGGGGAAGAAGLGGAGGAAGGAGAGGAAGAAGTGGAGGGAGAAGSGGVGGAGAGGAAGGGGVGGKAGAGGAAGGAGTAGGAGAAGSGQTDAGAIDAGTHPTDAGCQGVALPGSGVPAGTVATASMTLSVDGGLTYGPSNVIDGDTTTEWIAPGSTAWLTLTFPAPVMISAIRLHADALPESVELYTLSTSVSTVVLGSAMLPVKLAPGGVLPDIQVTPGMYSNITLSVNAGGSWVGINEVWLLAAPACP